MDKTFKNVSDILDEKGKCIFWISSYRLDKFNYFEPKITGTSKRSNTHTVGYKSEIKSAPVYMYSIPWMKEKANEIGHVLDMEYIKDPLREANELWFVLTKKS